MYLKWLGRFAFLAVVFVGADYYATSTVRDRMANMQETLVAPNGQWVNVSGSDDAAGPRRLTSARIVSVDEVLFGYRVTYAMPTRPTLTCTYRLPGVSCEDGWTVFWSFHKGAR